MVARLSAWLQLKRPDFSEVQGPSPRVQRCRLELLPFSFPLTFPQHLQLFPLQVLLLGLPPGQLNGLLCLLLVILVLQLAQVLLQRIRTSSIRPAALACLIKDVMLWICWRSGSESSTCP